MGRWLCPDRYVSSLDKVTEKRLAAAGIRGIIIDLDNTIVAWHCSELAEETEDWIQGLIKGGFKVCLVSNNLGLRVSEMAGRLGIPGIANASKPRSRPFRLAMELMGTERDETAVIGDQLFTDVLGGNRVGLFTILVQPCGAREFIGTQLMRVVERGALRWLARRRGLKLDQWDK